MSMLRCPMSMLREGWRLFNNSDAKCFRVLEEGLSMHECVARCEETANSSLACIESEQENTFITDALVEDKWFWIGLFKSDTESSTKADWQQWVSGCGSDYRNWNERRPMDWFFTRSDCAGIDKSAKWFNSPCSARFQCICQFPASTAPGNPPAHIITSPVYWGLVWQCILAVVLALIVSVGLFEIVVSLVHRRTRAQSSPSNENAQNTLSSAEVFKRNREANKTKALTGVLLAGGVTAVVGGGVIFLFFTWLPAMVCGTYLLTVGLLIMSTAHLDLDEFFNSRPALTYAFSLFLALFSAGFGLLIGIPPYLLALPCLPLVFALCLGRHVRRTSAYTTVVCAFLVLFLVAAGVPFLLKGSSGDRIRGAVQLEGCNIIGRVQVISGSCMVLLWLWATRVQRMTNTDTCFTVLYAVIFTAGLGNFFSQSFYGARDGAVSLFLPACLPWIILPPFMLVHRKRFFSLMSRRFESKQRLGDGAFLAALMDAAGVRVGQEWWVHLGEEHTRRQYAESDHRRHWRRGVVSKLEAGHGRFVAGAKAPEGGFWVVLGRRGLVKSVTSAALLKHRPSELASDAGTHVQAKATPSNAVVPVMAQEPADKVWVPSSDSQDQASLLGYAQTKLRCVDWDAEVMRKLFIVYAGGRRANKIKGPEKDAGAPTANEDEPHEPSDYDLSRPLKNSETQIDFFISHSWHDDGRAKFVALQKVAENFKRHHGRYPTLWLDVCCFDQNDLSNSLKVLPVNIQACDKVLVLCGETYCQRLWCVWELYIVFAFAPKEQAAARVQLLPATASATTTGDGVVNLKELPPADPIKAGTNVPTLLSTFALAAAHCYDPNEENKIRSIIGECGEHSFVSQIRELGEALRLRPRKYSFSTTTIARNRKL